jgi:transposase-like protein
VSVGISFVYLLKKMVTKSVCCKECGSEHIIKNGSNAIGNAKYKCKSCGFGGVFESKRASEETKELAVRAIQERGSLRGVGRIYGVSRSAIASWVKKNKKSP